MTSKPGTHRPAVPLLVTLAAVVMLLCACAGSGGATGGAGSSDDLATPASSPSSSPRSSSTSVSTSNPRIPSGNATAAAPAAPSYSASWGAGGASGWIGPSDWKTVDGMLVNDGTGEYSSFKPIFAPYHPPSANYAVEAQIRVSANSAGSSFGLVARADGQGGGYAGGAGSGWDQTTGINDLSGGWGAGGLSGRLVQGAAFDPGMDWHTYRLEVRGNTVRLLIDGAEAASVTDNKYLSTGRVGLWCNTYQVEVRSFTVGPV